MNLKGVITVEYVSKIGSLSHTIEIKANGIDDDFDGLGDEVKKAVEEAIGKIEYPITAKIKAKNKSLAERLGKAESVLRNLTEENKKLKEKPLCTGKCESKESKPIQPKKAEKANNPKPQKASFARNIK